MQVGPGREEVVYGDEQQELSALFAQLWGVLFAGELGPLPEWVHSPCCAEFVVSKGRVRSHPRRFYVDMLDWLTYTTQVLDVDPSCKGIMCTCSLAEQCIWGFVQVL